MLTLIVPALMSFDVRETADIEEVKKIVFDPEIYERISVEGIDNPDLPTDNVIYIGGYLDGEIIALMVYYIRENYTTCHVHVLRAHRAMFAVKFGRESLKLRPCDTLFTNIPPFFPEVIKFAEHFGFKRIKELSSGDFLYGVNYGFY